VEGEGDSVNNHHCGGIDGWRIFPRGCWYSKDCYFLQRTKDENYREVALVVVVVVVVVDRVVSQLTFWWVFLE